MEKTVGGPDGGVSSHTAPRGVIGEFLGLVASLTRHIQALATLAGEEAREAAALYIRLLILIGVAVLFAAFGYVGLILFLSFLASSVLNVSWLWILLALTALHFLVAAGAGIYVARNWRTQVFRVTGEEIKRDLDALSRRKA